MVDLTPEQLDLLRSLQDTAARGGFAVACDGKDRAEAHVLDRAGLAEWKGTSWGSSFWAITEAGIQHLTAAST